MNVERNWDAQRVIREVVDALSCQAEARKRHLPGLEGEPTWHEDVPQLVPGPPVLRVQSNESTAAFSCRSVGLLWRGDTTWINLDQGDQGLVRHKVE